MSAHVLLNLLSELRKRDKMRGLPSILSLFRNEFNKFDNTRARMLDSIHHRMRGLPSILFLFRNEFNKFDNTRARMLDSIYHMTNTLKSHFWRKNVMLLSLCTQRFYGRHNVSRKSINH